MLRKQKVDESNIEENFTTLLKFITSAGDIKIHHSLSEVAKVVERVEVVDIPRTAFTLVAVSLCLRHNHFLLTKEIEHAIDAVFSFVQSRRFELEGLPRVFTELYLAQSSILLKKEEKLRQELLRDFFTSISAIENIYNNPLLANKIILFYEEYKTTVSMSYIERLVGNLKSAMLYSISSNVSESYAFYQFAGMVVWSRGLPCEEKVLNYFLSKIGELDLDLVSSSGLAYLVECFSYAGQEIPERVILAISGCRLVEDENYSTTRTVPYGLYLNTRYENAVCLDTNTHLLLGALRSKLHV